MTIDINRLIRIIGMLGSAHDGEVLNAARLASNMLENEKLRWEDIIKKPGGFDRRANHTRYMRKWRARQKQRA